MALIPLLPSHLPTQNHKKMLSIAVDPLTSKTRVSINSSSLDIMQTCLRKAQYTLSEGLISSGAEPEALSFGTAIHKALEHWYSLPLEQRELKGKDVERAELMGFSDIAQGYEEGTALASVARFVKAGKSLAALGEGDKRSLSNGIKILIAYFKHYANDKLIVLSDVHGPLIERTFCFEMGHFDEVIIEYFGTIDVILQNQDTGLIMVADHKTTASLGRDFFNRIRPNHQYTGYVMGAQMALGLATNLFMVNGIQVAKTKCEFARQFTERTEEDFLELRYACEENIKRYIYAQKSDIWPMSSPGPCSNYGGCSFLDACSVPSNIRKNVISARWRQKESRT